MEDTQPRLENWAFNIYWSGFASPADVSSKRVILTGTVYGHPNGKRYDPPRKGDPVDGEDINTTRVQTFDPVKFEAKTKNTTYKLGAVGPEFSKWLVQNGFDLDQYADAFQERLENLQPAPEAISD